MPTLQRHAMRSYLAAALLFVTSVCLAADPVTDAIHKLDPHADIDMVMSGPVPHFTSAVVNGQPLYISDDGRYVLQGHLYDLVDGLDVTAAREAGYRAKLLGTLTDTDRIRFAPPHPLYRVTVFVDTDCGYCKILVNSLDSYLAQGIELDMVAFPRGGLGKNPAYDLAQAVWCASDPHAALRSVFAGSKITSVSCPNPVAKDFQIGVKLRLVGTPSILSDDGTILGGMVPAPMLRHKLDDLAAQARARAAANGMNG
jgi:thiol:disulfide interchange protein DsbC